jgi:hypothetical protein
MGHDTEHELSTHLADLRSRVEGLFMAIQAAPDPPPSMLLDLADAIQGYDLDEMRAKALDAFREDPHYAIAVIRDAVRIQLDI